MSDIFISYKREDGPRAQQIASGLKQRGYSVWWDRKIPPGKTFDQVIQEALDKASCVIVLWSKISVQSDWVKEEAEKGASRGILVPVLIDEVPIPLGFGRIQTANLVAWDSDISRPDWQDLERSIAVMLGRAVETSRTFLGFTDIPSPPPPQSRERGKGRSPGSGRGILGRAAMWTAAVLVSASVGAGVFYYVDGASGEPVVRDDTGSVPTPIAGSPAATEKEPLPPAASGASPPADQPPPADPKLQQVEKPGRETDEPSEPGGQSPQPVVHQPGSKTDSALAAGEQSPQPVPAPLANSPAVAAYRQLAELRRLADEGVGDAVLEEGYEQLWSEYRQELDPAAAAQVLRTLESLKAANESLAAFDPGSDLTVLDRLSHWRRLSTAHAGTRAGARAAERVEELEQMSSGSATIAAKDKFVTCERVARGEGVPSRPIGVGDEFGPGMVYVFAWVNSPRQRETLTLQWMGEGGTVNRSHQATVGRNTAAGYRIFYSKQHSVAGQYEVRLLNEGGELIGRRTFTVRGG